MINDLLMVSSVSLRPQVTWRVWYIVNFLWQDFKQTTSGFVSKAENAAPTAAEDGRWCPLMSACVCVWEVGRLSFLTALRSLTLRHTVIISSELSCVISWHQISGRTQSCCVHGATQTWSEDQPPQVPSFLLLHSFIWVGALERNSNYSCLEPWSFSYGKSISIKDLTTVPLVLNL